MSFPKRSRTWLPVIVLFVACTALFKREDAKPWIVATARGQDASSEKPGSAKPAEAGAPDERPGGKFTQGLGVSLGHNESGDTLWGFSDELGKLAKLKIPKPEKPPVVNFGTGFGFYLADGRIYGFSAKTGEWTQPDLPEKTRIFTSTTAGQIGVAYAADRIYGYSPSTGRWAELMTKVKPVLLFTKLVLNDGGQTHIFSDATGRWSSTSDDADPTDAGSSRPDGDSTTSNPKNAATGKKGSAEAEKGGDPLGLFSKNSGSRGFLPNAGIVPGNFVQGPSVGLMQSEERDKLWGYSVPLGKWTGLTIPKTEEPLRPTLGSAVGAFAVDGCLYAFSSQTGRWDVLKTTAKFIVHPDRIVVEDQGKIHIFSNVTGRWSSSGQPGDEIRGDAADAGPDRERPMPFLFDARGRQIVMGDLDRDGDLDIVVQETSEHLSAVDLLESLKARSAEADRDVAQRAAEIHKIRGGPGDPVAAPAGMKSRLEQAVREAFDRRQHAQRLEAEILRLKLRRVEARLLEREQTRSAIISRRVHELLETPATSPPTSQQAPEKPAEARPSSRTGNRRSGSATSETYPAYASRGHASRTVGVVSKVDRDGRILLSLQEPSGVRVGDEVEVSRPDFVHEDGTQQYYSFARLFVVEVQPDSAIALIVEIARTRRDDKYVNEEIAPGNMVGISIEKPEKRPEAAQSELVPLQGRWRLNRWVDEGRVMPPGDLKGSRHLMFVDGNRVTFIDPSAGRILDRFEIFVHGKTAENPRVVGIGVNGGGKTNISGIYELEESRLRICIRTGAGGLEFEPGANRTLWEFTRDGGQPREAGEKPKGL